MLPAAQLRAMAAAAMKRTRPKNGKAYVIGFANLQRNIAFGILTEKGIRANADAAGITLDVLDNRLDGPAALANAQTFVRDRVDFAIEFETDVSFGPNHQQPVQDRRHKRHRDRYSDGRHNVFSASTIRVRAS